MAAFTQEEMELVSELVKANPENDLTELVDGGKFSAQGLRDSYDGQYWR